MGIRASCWRSLGAQLRMLGLKWLVMQIPQEGEDFIQDLVALGWKVAARLETKNKNNNLMHG